MQGPLQEQTGDSGPPATTAQRGRALGEKTFQCHLCSGTFRTSSNLQGHIQRNHIGLKEHVCARCGKGFYSLNKLNRHLDSHNNIKRWAPNNFNRFEEYLAGHGHDDSAHNRIKRRAKNTRRFNTQSGPKLRERPHHYLYPEPVKDKILEFTTSTKKPGILPDHMNPGVIFRVRMSDAILRIKQRMYEDPERHIEADIIYTNLIKKVVMDEITKFHNLLLMYKTDKSIKEHLGECGGRIYKFISYMTIKVHIYCLFDALWIDGNPYVIGDEYTVTPVEVPPMLQCDAAECNSV
ncbi:Uncharacterized protein OBRU01_15511, partial [Operophtera brumata]